MKHTALSKLSFKRFSSFRPAFQEFDWLNYMAISLLETLGELQPSEAQIEAVESLIKRILTHSHRLLQEATC